MAGLDDLYNQIPVADIASKLGVDQGEVNQAIQTLVPTLLGTLQENVQADDIDSAHLESVVVAEGESDLLTGGVNVDQLDEGQGNQMIASLFGGNDTNQVASALSGAGAGGGDLIKRLLPMLAPIVLAYVGKQFSQKNAGAQAQASGGGIGDILGSILGGAAGGGGAAANNPLGSILGSVLGGGQGGALGNILGGLLRGGK
ncbi:DUF937 domain-containing protein [Mycolicibacterium sp.]|uniref:DUF937 domain-containing protein n=1 Tax=Mycolicibacterium sp. TaxID=2320850 RepID=UPI0025F42B16|nr:DUF937 domain-containing protein [Mycolicibacterium sp.]